MNRQDFFELILDHYERPRNRGVLDRANAVMKGSNPACGDIVTLYLRINQGSGVIEEIRFVGEGCTISQAMASLTTERVKGQQVTVARQVRAADLLEPMDASVLTSRRRCATLALHTLRAALTQYVMEHAPELPPLEAQEGSWLRLEDPSKPEA